MGQKTVSNGKARPQLKSQQNPDNNVKAQSIISPYLLE
ncbi:MAG: hypothetical protein BWY57_03313 [Betaproteobacteria bacterium ADurb.Bin341]|jgi:hypothetical protein|nr:MAG: hypothetical protein BWY57_03313 [Betaproteobacteria bacterium ADurb.Bin341]